MTDFEAPSAPATPALFRRYPFVRSKLPHLALIRRPSPVEPLRLDGLREVWVKRDDLGSAEYGGNKPRKLEFLLAHAREAGARRLITAGAAGSHHALATTVHGRAQGFDVSLVLFPQPLTPHVRRVLLADAALGAELRWAPRMEAVPLAVTLARLAHAGEGSMVIQPGGSSAVGALGYVDAALELAEQVEAGELPAPDQIVVAGGTLGTAAGLALGLALAGLEARVRAIRITSRIVTNQRALEKLIRGAARVLRNGGLPEPPVDSALGRVAIVEGFIGDGYGRETPAAREAAERLGEAGLTLDPTYTAKAAAALLAEDEPGGVRLFWHTLSGSMPDVTADARQLPGPFRRYLGEP